MAGVIKSIPALTTEIDTTLGSGQGFGAITAARVRQLQEDTLATIIPTDQQLLFSLAMTWNMTTQPNAYVILTGNPTITVTSGDIGATYRLAIIQGGVGSFTPTFIGLTILGSTPWQTVVGGINLVGVEMIGYLGGTAVATVA